MTSKHPLAPTRFPDTITIKARGPGLHVAGRAELEEAPRDGTRYFGIEAPLHLSMTAGKGEPVVSRRRD